MTLRDQGNLAFKAGEFHRAAAFYTRALKDDEPEKATLYRWSLGPIAVIDQLSHHPQHKAMYLQCTKWLQIRMWRWSHAIGSVNIHIVMRAASLVSCNFSKWAWPSVITQPQLPIARMILQCCYFFSCKAFDGGKSVSHLDTSVRTFCFSFSILAKQLLL